MASQPPTQAQLNLAALAGSPSPRTMRGLRKIQSHQTLSSSPSLASSLLPNTRSSAGPAELSQPAQLDSPVRLRTHRRARSNSDASSQTLLRDGPQQGNVQEALQELRYLVLSTRVEADGDGMSTYRVYLWLILLDIPLLPADEYISLIHRGRSPAYTKIRNDTFRTLATDPLFKRRVTEASLIRLLNAVAWRLHDAKSKHKLKSRPSSSRRREMELLINTPPSIAEEEPSADDMTPSSASNNSLAGSHATNSPGITSESAIYVQGMNVLCAPFLYAARSEAEAFALFHTFITRECPGYIRGAMDGVHRGLVLVDRCLEIVEPKLAAYLFSKGLQAKLPNKILRSFPPLDAKEIIALAVLIVRKIPEPLYAELIGHAK
ncbi:hypothetical protein AOCH_006407 [Aspergillus ochraceoroseus]|uniref:Rab-GAP TBC domain-containing protein n=1 Tax=Aspergillus ochraceoroseus TaxID=138278 RepID=A0A0F8UEK2_9EURO|nr:hypothetical protein AOCH_006407 [Aspergillus ochraceoroseus]